MPREARKLKPLTAYHVMVQGLNKEKIFTEDEYKRMYLYILKKQLDEYKVKMIAYCVMINHAHLLLYSEDNHTISKMMHKVNANFSMYYNKKLSRVGFVFRDRFLSQEIFDYHQLMVCINYIHNNPLKSNLVKTPEKYAFSSCNDYKYRRSWFVDFDLISHLFKGEDVMDYLKYTDDSFKLKEPEIFDEELFNEEIVSKIDIMKILKDEDLLRRFLVACKEKYFVPNKVIGELLNVSEPTIGRWMKEIRKQKMETCP